MVSELFSKEVTEASAYSLFSLGLAMVVGRSEVLKSAFSCVYHLSYLLVALSWWSRVRVI
jgi:hypothetical protein